jgi:WD40 repeat protein
MDDHSVAIGSSRSGVRIWQQVDSPENKGKIGRALLAKTHPIPSRVMSLASLQMTLAAGCWDMNIYIFQDVLCNTLVGHCDAVLSLQFQDDCLFSGGADGTIKIWLWEESLCINTLNIEAGYVHRIVGNSRFAVAATGCSLTRLVVWDLSLDSTIFFAVQRGRVKAIVLSEDYFITGGSETPAVEVWNLTGTLLQKFTRHSKPITDLLLLNDEVLSSSEDKWIYLWAWKTDTILFKSFGFTASVFHLTPKEKILACENKGNSIQLYDFKGNSTQLYDFQDSLNQVTLLFRTLSQFECRNSSFRRSLSLDISTLEDLENYINYIK